ncbi:MAG: insulinase family protein [Bryobacterales bacterium]|nr:insulinase family protein [Bryobacterales bacterium]
MLIRILLALTLSAVACLGQSVEVKQHTLSNGMKVLIHEDYDVPNVAMYLFYRIGSRNESPGTTGIAHFFEHMMFNGSKKFGPKQFDIEMEKAGGRNNAYTSNDVTVYTDFFPATALELMFDMEADRIANLSLEPKIVESERGVVYSERRLTVDNNPGGLLYEQLRATAFIAHPYQWPVIGWASDIESWTREDLLRYYRMGYAPNNCTVVIAGAVNEGQVLELAKKHLEPIPSHAPPPPVTTKEPKQNGERRLVVYKEAQLPLQMMAWHVPETKSADTVPLEVLGTLLSEGRSSRLYKRMVDGQLALEAQCSGDRSLDPGVFMCVVAPRSGVETAAAEKALFEEIEKLRTATVESRELRKAKNQLLAGYYRELTTIANKAEFIGNFEVFQGDWSKVNGYAAQVEAVTAEDVKRVASTYLDARNRTVATLIPEESSAGERQ